MTEAVRISTDRGWTYVPLSDKGSLAIRLASANLAEASPAGIRLFSEEGGLLNASGPIKQPTSESAARLLSHLDSNALALVGSEKLVLASIKDAKANNDFLGLSLVEGSQEIGIPTCEDELENGEIVLTLWPAEKTIQPGVVRKAGQRWSVEFPLLAPKGSRCFILDEAGERLKTASLPSNGSDSIAVWPSLSVRSWLMGIGAKAMDEAVRRFVLEAKGDKFLISDNRTGRRMVAAAKGTQGEQSRIWWTLVLMGPKGLLGSYDLGKA